MAGAPTGQHGRMDTHTCPPRHARPCCHTSPRDPSDGQGWGSLTPCPPSSWQSRSSTPGIEGCCTCRSIAYLAPRPADLSRPPSHAVPAPRLPGGCSSHPEHLGCPPGLPLPPFLRNCSSSAWAALVPCRKAAGLGKDGQQWALGPGTCMVRLGTAPQLALKPGAQRVYGDEVGLELTVGVEEQPVEPGHEARSTPHVGAQEDTSAVIVVGVEVVPDDGTAPQDSLHLLQQHR